MRQARRRHQAAQTRINPSGAPRPLARRMLGPVLLCAALALGVGLGARGFEPLARRYVPVALFVSSVSISGAERVSHAEIGELVRSAAAGPAGVDSRAIAERIARHPFVAEARVRLLWPGRLLVTVVERVPAATLRVSDGSHWLVDEDGTAFLALPRRAAELPLLVGPESAELDVRRGLLAEGIELARLAQARGIGEVKEVRVVGPHPGAVPQLTLRGRPQIIIVGAGNTAAKLDRLAALLESDLAEVRRASEIDLRFGDRMVLRGGPSLFGDEAAAGRGRAGSPEPRPLG